jgi:hypothetical protein
VLILVYHMLEESFILLFDMTLVSLVFQFDSLSRSLVNIRQGRKLTNLSLVAHYSLIKKMGCLVSDDGVRVSVSLSRN